MPKTRRKEDNRQSDTPAGLYMCLTAGNEDHTPDSYGCIATTLNDCASAAHKTARAFAEKTTVKNVLNMTAKSAAGNAAAYLHPGIQSVLICNGILAVTRNTGKLLGECSDNLMEIESQRAQAAAEHSADDEKFQWAEAPLPMKMR